jgi:hypothetical protein
MDPNQRVQSLNFTSHQEPLLSSPLLGMIGQSSLFPESNLSRAAQHEILTAHYRTQPPLFPALMQRCRDLLPSQRFNLCGRFFRAISDVVNSNPTEKNQKILDQGIVEILALFGNEALGECWDAMEIQSFTLQIQSLVSLGHNKQEMIQQFDLMATATLANQFIRLLLTTDKKLVRGMIVSYACSLRGTNPFQSLAVARNYLGLCLAKEPDPECHVIIGANIAELTLVLGQQGFESCRSVQEFEALAKEIHSLLDLSPFSRQIAQQMASSGEPTAWTPIFQGIFSGLRGPKFLELLVFHQGESLFTPQDWNYLGSFCLTTSPSCSIELWLALGAHGRQADLIQTASNKVIAHLITMGQNRPQHGLSPMHVGKLISQLHRIDPAKANWLRELSGIHSHQHSDVNAALDSTLPTISTPRSALLKLITREQEPTEPELTSAARHELISSRSLFGSNRFPFPDLLEGCRLLPIDQSLNLCLRFFTPLEFFARMEDQDRVVVSHTIAELVLLLSREGLNARSDYQEIQAIAFHASKLLDRCEARESVIKRLQSTDNLTPSDRLILNIAKSQRHSPLHHHVIRCASEQRGLNSLQTLTLAWSYLRSLWLGPNLPGYHAITAEMVADCAVTYGASAIESCQNFREFEAAAAQLHALLAYHLRSREEALARLALVEKTARTPVLQAVFEGKSDTKLLEFIVFYFADEVFTPNDWDNLAERCWMLGLNDKRNLWIAAAANGSRHDVAIQAWSSIAARSHQLSEFLNMEARIASWVNKICKKLNWPSPTSSI